MRTNKTTIFGLLFLTVLAVAPSVAAWTPFAPSQADFEDIISLILTRGAEVALASVDDGGVPIVVYGQVGVPSDVLQLTDPMYQGCLAMALVATRGGVLEYILQMVGFMNSSSSQGMTALTQYAPAQTMPQSPQDIIGMLGSDIKLLVAIYVNIDQAVSQGRISQVLNLLSTNFGFSFAPFLILRIDKTMFPPEMADQIPFDSIDLYSYTIGNEFPNIMSSVFQVMDDSGILGGISTNVFIDSPMAATGILVVPDMSALGDLFGSTESSSLAEGLSPFTLAQMANLTGPMVVAAAGYMGEQVVSSTDTSLGLAQLLGASSLTPLSGALSMVAINMPTSVNITSFTPSAENYSFYDPSANMVAWNATHFGVQPDYRVYFGAEQFPPMIRLERTITPSFTAVGGSAQVTVTVRNEGNAPIENLFLNDTGVSGIYTTISLTGENSKSAPVLAPNQTLTVSYQVQFTNEGSYTFPRPVLQYVYNNRTYVKLGRVQSVVVSQDLAGFIGSAIMDGMPFSGAILALVALVGLYSVRGIIKSRGAGAYNP
ncbi:MAG: hypothetical protein QXS20_04770 [Candidatus Thorarchaeota archaeon]